MSRRERRLAAEAEREAKARDEAETVARLTAAQLAGDAEAVADDDEDVATLMRWV